MNILILYARTQREMDSLVMMKIELEKRGHYVEMAHITAGFKWLCDRFYEYDIILTSAAYDDDSILVYRFGEDFPMKRFISMNWEQYWGSNNLYIPTGMAMNVTNLCWGAQRAEELINNNIPEENVFISGPMQFDFCRPELRYLLKNKHELALEYNLPEDKEWILFIGSFAYTGLINIQNIRVGNAIEPYNYQISVYPIFIEWIGRFARNHSNTICIYRPHPLEVLGDRIIQLNKEIDNLKILPYDNVRAWINASSHCNLVTSTTIADVFVLDKTCSIVHPLECGERINLSLIRDAKYVNTYEEFENENINCRAFPSDIEILNKSFARTEKPAYINVCDIAESVHMNTEKPDYSNRLNNDILKYNTENAGKLNAAACLIEMMGDDCIFLCEVIANLLEIRDIVCGAENNLLVYERESYKLIKEKEQYFCEKLGFEYSKPKDIASTEKLLPEVECFNSTLYNRFLDELEIIQLDETEERERKLLEILYDLFAYQAETKVGELEKLQYMEPYSVEIAKAISCKMRREKYEAPLHLKGEYIDYTKPLNNKKNIVLYGAGRAGSAVYSIFKECGYNFEVWDKDYGKHRLFNHDILPPFNKEPSDNLIVAIAIGYQDQYTEVRKMLIERGYSIIDAVFTTACLRAQLEKGEIKR